MRFAICEKMIASLMEEKISMKAEVESRLWIIVHRKE
jgi:hypothetical protein